MKKLIIALAALPLMAGVATAGQPSTSYHVASGATMAKLSDQQMDYVTAGFTALSIADAEGLVGESGVVLTTTASLSQVLPLATATCAQCEAKSTIYKSLAAAASSTVTSSITPAPIPGTTP